MNDSERRHRFEDIGLGGILKYLPLLALIFTAGAWYQTAKANAILTDSIRRDVADNSTRITRVEDAVIYLKEIVKSDRQGHAG